MKAHDNSVSHVSIAAPAIALAAVLAAHDGLAQQSPAPNPSTEGDFRTVSEGDYERALEQNDRESTVRRDRSIRERAERDRTAETDVRRVWPTPRITLAVGGGASLGIGGSALSGSRFVVGLDSRSVASFFAAAGFRLGYMPSHGPLFEAEVRATFRTATLALSGSDQGHTYCWGAGDSFFAPILGVEAIARIRPVRTFAWMVGLGPTFSAIVNRGSVD